VAVSELSGKRCLVTGAASGIGRAAALAVAAKGAEVYLTDVEAERLSEVGTEIERAGGTVGHLGAIDIADHDAVVGFAEEVHRSAGGSMDVVMNIAGVSTWGTVEQLEHRDWQKMIDINLMGPISVIETFVPPMIEAGRGGHIVNVSSAAGLVGLPWHAAYSASKFGLRGVSEVLRFDLRRHGIGVSLVCPGMVKTPLVGTLEVRGVDRQHPKLEETKVEFEKRAVTPEQVAKKIVRGIEKNRYLVFTSPDIRLLHWWQRKFSPVYKLVMLQLQRRFDKMLAATR
jgi:NAD(P)-dependent dehydrogenase (short-subunit alcohol dehydrogenase family)